jgi:hypothetical protein
VKSPISCELALGMSLALESSEADIERSRVLIADREGTWESQELASQLLLRAKRRIETVRLALGQIGDAFLD